MRVLLLSFLMLAGGLAGCLATEAPDRDPSGPLQALIGEPIVLDHDHTDHRLHTGSAQIDLVGWSPLGVELGENGFANFVIHEDDDETLAFVAVDGDQRGGFDIADISTPSDIRMLGSYRIDGNGIQEVRVTPDGRYAVMNVQDVPSQQQVLSPDGPADCSVCIHVVDVSDRTDPRLVSVHPVELLGTHNLDFEVIGGELYLFYVGQPLYLPYPDPGNHVYIARFVEDAQGARIVPVSSFDMNEVVKEGRSFPHDVLVQEHPLTGQKIAYVSHWDGGAVLFDVSDPLVPAFLGVEDTAAPSDALAIHWIMQEEAVRADGRVIAWSAPEIGSLTTGSGVVRAYDVTDPAAIRQVGTWGLPGDVVIEGRYIFSPHTAVPDPQRGLVAVTHYHAGVWVLDATDPEAPEALGYYLPHGDPEEPFAGQVWWKKPNFSPDGYGPNVYQARWHEDLLWVTDRGTGLYALEYTGPVPGDVTAA